MTRSLFHLSSFLPIKVLPEDWAFCVTSYKDLLGFLGTCLYLQCFRMAGYLGVILDVGTSSL